MIRRAAILLSFMLILAGAPARLGAQGATAEQYYQYGNKYYAAKNYNYAARYYYAAVKANPNMPQAYQGLGNCFLLMGRKAEALKYYEKALQLNPSNPQLSAYVNNLRNQLGAAAPAAAAPAAAAPAAAAPAAAAPAAAAPKGESLAKGQALFQQKQYAAAIPLFEQATRETPNDYKPFYYLGYSQYVTRDYKNAAVNFYLSNQKQANPQLKAYADRIKASLPPADQQWVDARVAAGGAPAKAEPAAAKAAEKAHKAGLRAIFGMALFNLKDFNADADMQEKMAKAGGYGLNGEVTKGSIWVGGEPYFRLTKALEMSLGFAAFPVGKYSYTAQGYGLLPTYDPNDAIRNVFKVGAQQISLSTRYYIGKSKSKAFLGLGGAYYPAKINWSNIVASYDGTIATGFEGDFTSSGMGGHIMLGGDFTLGSSVGLSPYVMYRMAKLKDFEGSIAETQSGLETSGTLALLTNSTTGDSMIIVDDGNLGTLPAPLSVKPLELDLSGVQVGLGISVAF